LPGRPGHSLAGTIIINIVGVHRRIVPHEAGLEKARRVFAAATLGSRRAGAIARRRYFCRRLLAGEKAAGTIGLPHASGQCVKIIPNWSSFHGGCKPALAN
ncbi:MAG: hypothetical protein LC637_09385, partial [Xanthomonadaceae bacterium]|nr:hypothetical protein [Xanthomonadaceae bacterium]